MVAFKKLMLPLLIGLILRLLAVGLVAYEGSNDEPEYETLAYNLSQHGALSYSDNAPYTATAARMPMEPLFVAATYKLFGHHRLPARLLQIFISLLTGVLLYLAIASWEPRFARIMLWLAMLSPFEILFAPLLMTETLSEFFLVLAFVVPWLMRSRYVWFLSGVALALLILTREVYALLPFLIALILVIPKVKKIFFPDGLAHAAVLLLTVVVLMAPWIYRNYRVTGDFIPLTRGFMWENLWVGTWQDINHGWGGSPMATPQPPYLDAAEKSTVEGTVLVGVSNSNPTFKRLAWARFRAHPARIVARWLVRAPLLWFGTRCPFRFKPEWLAHGSISWKVLKLVFLALNTVMILTAIGGLIICLWQRSILLWFAIPIAYTISVYLPFPVLTRYSQPVFLFLTAFGLYAVWSVVQRKAKPRDEPLALAA